MRAWKGLCGGVLGLALAISTAGVAHAVSGGGYQPSQQDCNPTSDSWGTPAGFTTPGCHNISVNLESGSTTNGSGPGTTTGTPAGGETRYAEFGLDQLPLGGPPGTPTEESIGYPGQDDSPHQGCLAFNTNGTGGGPGTPDGCGNNPAGLGSEINFNYYDIFCPIVTALTGIPANPYIGSCPAPPANEWTQTTGVTPDSGTPDIAGLLSSFMTRGLMLNLNADDNLDAGEHDGTNGLTDPLTDGSITGPSDGGASQVFVQPQNLAVTPTLTDLIPFAGGSLGFCADGNCIELTTRQQTIYEGCGANTGENVADDQCPSGAAKERDAADYTGKQWHPPNCNSGDTKSQSPASCDSPPANPSGGMDYWRTQEAQQVNTQPGLQEYEDPDAQGSPLSQLPYPNPALYVGSCGVILGGGALPPLPASPITNSAGQLDINTGC
jgi:hypothetical protein